MARSVNVSYAEAQRLIEQARRVAGGPQDMAAIVKAAQTANKAEARKNRATASGNTATLIRQCTELGCPEPFAEWDFRADRKWRFDLAWDDFGIAAEIEGGVHSQGRHTRAQGFVNDAHKYNAAACMGWTVIRIPTPMIADGTGALYVALALQASGCRSIIEGLRFPWEE